MPDPSEQFEHQLEGLSQEIEQRRGEYEGSEHKSENSPEKRALHEAVGERLGNPAQPSDDGGDIPQTPAQRINEEPSSYQLPELHEKVQELVNKAFEKDIDSAIEEAKKENNPALLDAFHDALVDYLYEHLVERGKLKEVQ